MGDFSRDCGIAVEGVAFPRKRRPFRQNSAYAVENPVYNLPQMWNRKDKETLHKGNTAQALCSVSTTPHEAILR